MKLFSDEEIKTEEATPSELVLRFYVRQLEANYKEGWLYYQCKDKGLLQIYQEFMTNGIFKLLKEGQEDGGSKKLTIELVPKTCWFSNVRSNVDQEQWNFLKKITAKKACYRCEICGGQGPKWPVECHEIWNYDDDSLIQKLVGLISLCPSCHKVKHMGFAELSGKSIETKCHLAIVNSWSYKETAEYVDQQFKIWRERSKYTWLLDLSWLEQYEIHINVRDRVALAYKDCEENERKYYLQHRKRSMDLFFEALECNRKNEFEKAMQLYIEAASYGNIDAIHNLASYHLLKRITGADYEQGICFLKEAERLGDLNAKKLVLLSQEELKKLIDIEQKKILGTCPEVNSNNEKKEELISSESVSLNKEKEVGMLKKAFTFLLDKIAPRRI